MEFIYDMLSFVLKSVIIVFAIAAVIGIMNRESKQGGKVKVTYLNDKFSQLKNLFMSDKLRKKLKPVERSYKSRTFVLDFKGSVMAPEVSSLSKEIDAILSAGNSSVDDVILNIQSPGGAVTGYGLGAEQIQRLRTAGFKVTATVDEVAASGGYLMASVANKIVASKFAIIGSIGVVAQMPNFKDLLDKVGVNYEVITAGKFKRTLTMVQENTEEHRVKFKEDLEQIHAVFKEHVAHYRPDINIDDVATGEHWLAADAIKRGLIDEIKTSDSLLREVADKNESQLVHLKFSQPKPLSKRLKDATASVITTVFTDIIAKMHDKTTIYR